MNKLLLLCCYYTTVRNSCQECFLLFNKILTLSAMNISFFLLIYLKYQKNTALYGFVLYDLNLI